jgi:hypothetical protein
MHPDKDDLEYVSFLKQLIDGKRLEGAALARLGGFERVNSARA